MVSKFFRSGETPNIGVVINPLSGGNRNGLEDVRSVISAHPQVIHCDVQTPDDVQVALAQFARQKVNLLAVNGGDGTVQAVLTAIFQHQPFEEPPLLAVLQSGTTSMTGCGRR
jgi:diacylglycerol kinase (ATP)